MMPLFPRAKRTCTRVPIHLRLRRCAPGDSHARLAVLDSVEQPQGPDAGRIISIEQGWERVQAVMDTLLCETEDASNRRSVRSDKTILLTVHHSRVPSIDLIDLPGIQTSSEEGRLNTEAMVAEHLREGSSDMCLLVHRWGAKCRTEDVGGLKCLDITAKARTIGVLTHCDWVETQRDRAHLRAVLSHELSAEATNDLGVARLSPHGWVAVASSDEAMEDTKGLARLVRLAREERAHFGSHPELQQLVDDGSATVDALVTRLEGMYKQVLEDVWLPDTLRRLDTLARTCERKLLCLGLPTHPTDIEARAEVDRRLREGYAELWSSCECAVLVRVHAAVAAACSNPALVSERIGALEARLLVSEHERFMRALLADLVADAHDEWCCALSRLIRGGDEEGDAICDDEACEEQASRYARFLRSIAADDAESSEGSSYHSEHSKSDNKTDDDNSKSDNKTDDDNSKSDNKTDDENSVEASNDNESVDSGSSSAATSRDEEGVCDRSNAHFKLERFPTYSQAVLDALAPIVRAHFDEIAASCGKVLDRVFDPHEDAWLRWEFSTASPSGALC
ncbi:hypothetical protein T492DRAFT_24700 [Pavlovales sp. CCMP2436]|nr:hypothetical protein T492DRAFT_24700 [Pavlovales sp. CCMP2436]